MEITLYRNNPTGLKKRGRPLGSVKKDSYIYITIGLRPVHWVWLGLWHEGTVSDQIRALLDRALKFWPAGPNRFR